MIGLGTVGQGVAELLTQHADLYAQRIGRRMQISQVLVRNIDKATATGAVDASLITNDADTFFNAEMDIVIEVAGGLDPVGGFVERALSAGKPVVTANKSLLAERGGELFALARQHQTTIAFEASCAGGIPVIAAMLHGLAANRYCGLYGILNGTCNYILSEMAEHGSNYDEVLKDAQDAGYAEADPYLDVSGMDAAQKLVILGSLGFGQHIRPDQLRVEGIDRLDLIDIRSGEELGYVLKLLAIAEQQEPGGPLGLTVEPCFIKSSMLLAQVNGPMNAVAITGDAVGPTLLYGAGAGKLPTASAVVSDLLQVASGAHAASFNATHFTPDCTEPAQVVAPDELVSRFYIRFSGMDRPGVVAKIATVLGEKQISISAVQQHESDHDQYVPLVFLTHEAKRADVMQAVNEIAAMDTINGEPVVIRLANLD